MARVYVPHVGTFDRTDLGDGCIHYEIVLLDPASPPVRSTVARILRKAAEKIRTPAD